ncbi:MAG: dTDP-4-dehydrorhamnose 3,5-epimerase [Candidatus Omnitrophica bacterium]|nr:dTDP-4-dehydrorhamnose 3,5-epimerase [Candidatus Omnitrophota bacterium]
MPFKFEKLAIPDVILVQPRVFPDDRGFFLEVFKSSDFKAVGIKDPFVQVNHSQSGKGVLRGLHYQIGASAQGKLVRCVRGEIYDVAVDIRRGSPWFGQLVSQTLSEDNKTMIYVPVGFAHGFCVVSDTAEIEYSCTREYDSRAERGIIWNDPDLNIAWPLKNPLVSPKDSILPFLKNADNSFVYHSK